MPFGSKDSGAAALELDAGVGTYELWTLGELLNVLLSQFFHLCVRILRILIASGGCNEEKVLSISGVLRTVRGTESNI